MPEGHSSQEHAWPPLIYLDGHNLDELVQRVTEEACGRASDFAIS